MTMRRDDRDALKELHEQYDTSELLFCLARILERKIRTDEEEQIHRTITRAAKSIAKLEEPDEDGDDEDDEDDDDDDDDDDC